MKHLIVITVICAGCLALGACQNRPHQPPNNFSEKTHRTYNPETGSFEQSPPWGKQSNKSTDQ